MQNPRLIQRVLRGLVNPFSGRKSEKQPSPNLQSHSLTNSVSENTPEKLPSVEVSSDVSSAASKQNLQTGQGRSQRRGCWERLLDEYRKNYYPRRSPPLVLPSAPMDVEKYSYVQMKRPFLIFCDLISLVSLGYSAWSFTSKSPVYAWFALYVTINELYILTALFVATIGKELDLESHKSFVESHALSDELSPSVHIYLPVCNEPLEILENTWKYVSAVQYPKGKLSVFVLDDGANDDGSDTSVKSLAKKFEFTYIRRPDRPHLKKSGNLRHAFAHTSGDFVIFDADFCPRADFLLETMPYLIADKTRAILQTPQFFRASRDQTWTEQGAGASQEIIYRIMETSRDRWGAAICVGSNAIYRRAAFEPIGGIVAIDCSEDIYTGWYAITHGWTVKYLPLVLACGICPDTPAGYFSQQMRWCHGTMSLVSRRDFWTGNAQIKVKLCFIISAINYITNAIEPFIFPPLAPLLLWTRPNHFQYYRLLSIYPSIILGFVARKIWARGRYTFSVLYADKVLAFASLHSIWDLMFGKSLNWKPTGGSGGSRKNAKYRNMRILAWGWTIAHTTALIVVVVYRVVGGLRWFNLMPIFVMNAISLLWLHRFLLYHHPKQ